MPIDINKLEALHLEATPVSANEKTPIHLSSTDCIELEEKYGAHK